VNVREKAKIVMVLIEDEEKRKEERAFAMKTKDKLTKAPTGKTHEPVSTFLAYMSFTSYSVILVSGGYYTYYDC